MNLVLNEFCTSVEVVYNIVIEFFFYNFLQLKELYVTCNGLTCLISNAILHIITFVFILNIFCSL